MNVCILLSRGRHLQDIYFEDEIYGIRQGIRTKSGILPPTNERVARVT